MPERWSCATLAVLCCATAAVGQMVSPVLELRAEIRPYTHQVPMGHPLWVTFRIENTGTESITLTVPGTEPEIPSPEIGLPITHVFSGGGTATGITVTTESGRRWVTPVGYRQPGQAPILMIAPRSSVGTTLDLRDYFPSLRGAGRYRVSWAPYGGRVISDPIVLTIASLQRAVIATDQGPLTIRFFYADAPRHVANFIELAQSGFYNGKLFHRLEPGYFIQGGCPRRDGSGIRTDGKRIAAEFNAHPMRKGTVAMALLDDDPDSASCQFFICNTRMKEWDGRYTVFGELVGEESFQTFDRLMAVKVSDDGRPDQPLIMQTIRLTDAPADELP